MQNASLMIALVASLFATSFSAQATDATAGQVALIAPGYGKLGFEPPAAGTYKLPPLNEAPNGTLLNTEGNEIQLHQLYSGSYTLMGFIYTRCDDVNGCPLTQTVFGKTKQLIDKDSDLSGKVRLLSISFDPENDTPEALKELTASGHVHNHASSSDAQLASKSLLKKINFNSDAPIDFESLVAQAGYCAHGQVNANGIPWDYLTADSTDTLYPLLDVYNQSILQRVNAEGESTGQYSHVLRVFLIDPKRRIRNIYSAAFLHHELIINDLKTLIKEDLSS